MAWDVESAVLAGDLQGAGPAGAAGAGGVVRPGLRAGRRRRARRGRSTGRGGWSRWTVRPWTRRTRPVNTARFGKPSAGQSKGAFPQVRVVAAAECGTHAVFAAAMDGVAIGEQALLRRLLGKLGPGMLVIADRNFLGFHLWEAVAATRADLLWRAKSDTRLPVDEELADGSYRSHLVEPDTRGRGRQIPVRVIEYTLQASESDHPHRAGEVYRLVTTILDPDAAPAEDLADAVRATMGDRVGLRRDQDPPARRPVRCCAPATRTGSTRRSGASCCCTTPSAT